MAEEHRPPHKVMLASTRASKSKSDSIPLAFGSPNPSLHYGPPDFMIFACLRGRNISSIITSVRIMKRNTCNGRISGFDWGDVLFLERRRAKYSNASATHAQFIFKGKYTEYVDGSGQA